MFSPRVLLLLVCTVHLAAASSDLDDAWSSLKDSLGSVGEFFKKQFNKIEDLFAENKEELEKKLDDTVTFLEAMEKEKDKLMATADEKGKEALEQLDEWIAETKEFSKEVKEGGEEKFTELEGEWETQAKKMYDEGFGDVVEMFKSGAASLIGWVSLLILIQGVLFLR